jgi:hypothetical protein
MLIAMDTGMPPKKKRLRFFLFSGHAFTPLEQFLEIAALFCLPAAALVGWLELWEFTLEGKQYDFYASIHGLLRKSRRV